MRAVLEMLSWLKNKNKKLGKLESQKRRGTHTRSRRCWTPARYQTGPLFETPGKKIRSNVALLPEELNTN